MTGGYYRPLVPLNKFYFSLSKELNLRKRGLVIWCATRVIKHVNRYLLNMCYEPNIMGDGACMCPRIGPEFTSIIKTEM